MKIKPWNHVLWGITLRRDPSPRMILGEAWHPYANLARRYPGEPPRPLLFRTRQQARDFCKMKSTRCSYPNYKFSAIKIIQSITPTP